MRTLHVSPNHKQRGVATVEFALVALLFFTLLLAIIEIGRMLFIFNTMQEMTRRGAREAVVRWADSASQADIKSITIFSGASMPANPYLTTANITITYTKRWRNRSHRFPCRSGRQPLSVWRHYTYSQLHL